MVEFENVELVEGSHTKCPHCGCFDYVEVIVKNVQLRKHGPLGYFKRCTVCGEITAVGGNMVTFEDSMRKWSQQTSKEIERLKNREIKNKEYQKEEEDTLFLRDNPVAFLDYCREQQVNTQRRKTEDRRIKSDYGRD